MVSVGPGIVDTRMQKDIQDAGSTVQDEGTWSYLKQRKDEGSMTTPEYVAEVIAKSINKLEIGGQIAGDTKAEALRETLHGNYFELAALDANCDN